MSRCGRTATSWRRTRDWGNCGCRVCRCSLARHPARSARRRSWASTRRRSWKSWATPGKRSAVCARAGRSCRKIAVLQEVASMEQKGQALRTEGHELIDLLDAGQLRIAVEFMARLAQLAAEAEREEMRR